MKVDPLVLKLLDHVGYQVPTDKTRLLENVLLAFSRIPYENITKINSSAEATNGIAKHSVEEVIDGFIRYGTGGTCFPLTLTLQHLIRSLGYEAYPILADRRYGADTHCALILRLSPSTWHLLDPGYLITTPCPIPTQTSAQFNLLLSLIELIPLPGSNRLELYTIENAITGGEQKKRYRLTYKLTPVDEHQFQTAWDRSFSWEMMQYPVISVVINNTQIYFQKCNLIVKNRSHSSRMTLRYEDLGAEINKRISIAPEIINRALATLRPRAVVSNNGYDSTLAKLKGSGLKGSNES